MLLNYTAINYLKHHLENHSVLLLTSGKQLQVAKTRRKKKKISLKESAYQKTWIFFHLYSCQFRSAVVLG